ncbi:C-type lectin domain family 2 member D-like isoform X2 [Rhinatrema bivittatum]|uniref:C-type lectin domain family 2 member D-like isoform X2 n=1 Tax=Rhinatrema bivittatum TaxID=194408 RepID=UPI00112E3C1E|nr:C-type lectin domain family 2 member D-like isoform X2 [Rhinatrema bivittatum]
MGHGADPVTSPQDEEFLPKKGIRDAETSRSHHGQADILFRRFPVPVITLVLLTALSLAVILGIIVLAVHLPADHCADGWIWYRGKCYFFSENSTDWDKAQSFCTSHSASLAHIETRQELNFTMRYKGRSDHWIGLRREQGQPWRWPDGSQFNNLFTILAESDCAYLNDAGPKSASCQMHRKWICTESGHSPF